MSSFDNFLAVIRGSAEPSSQDSFSLEDFSYEDQDETFDVYYEQIALDSVSIYSTIVHDCEFVTHDFS